MAKIHDDKFYKIWWRTLKMKWFLRRIKLEELDMAKKYSISEQSADLRKAKNYGDGLTILIRQNIVLQYQQERIISRLNRAMDLLNGLQPHKITDEDISFIKEMTG